MTAHQFPTHGNHSPARPAHISAQPQAGHSDLPRFSGLRDGELMPNSPTPLLRIHAVLIGALCIVPLVALMALTLSGSNWP